MSVVRTDLGQTVESARRLSFDKSANIPKTNVQAAIEDVRAALSNVTAIAATAVSSGSYSVQVTDTVLFVDSTGGTAAISLLLASMRAGVPLTIKDVGGMASANNITLTPSGGETIDGLASMVIATDYGGVRLYPRSGIGYSVAP